MKILLANKQKSKKLNKA